MRALLLAVFACVFAFPPRATGQDRSALEAELDQLRASLRIPAMSAAVVESGTLVWVRHFGSKPATGETVRYPITSLTQTFAAALAARLSDDQKLAFDSPVAAAGPRVAIRHLLSHTAAGTPGARFLYSEALFGLLDAPLEKASGSSVARAISTDVLRPLGLRDVEVTGATTANAGMMSTAEDLARFAAAVDGGRVASAATLTEMFRPPRGPTGRAFPHGLGWFVQQIGAEQVRWHFGQGQAASGVLVSLPRRRLVFVALAQTDRLSAPFWLALGDLRWSPAAMSFITRWPRLRLDLASARTVMTRALIDLAHGDRASAKTLTEKAAVLAPALVNGSDPVLLAAFARSRDEMLGEIGRRIGARLLAADPSHPGVLLDLATLHAGLGQVEEAARLLSKILAEQQATPEIERASRRLRDALKAP